MSRLLLAFMVALGFITCSFADPIKKATTVDSDKLTKECVEAFFKAALDGKPDEALKLCEAPFLTPGGKVAKTVAEVKNNLTSVPASAVMKVTDTIALEQYNEWAKKREFSELDADQLKQYGEFLGKEGRIVVFDLKVNGKALKKDVVPHMLIRIKDGKAQIVGVGHS